MRGQSLKLSQAEWFKYHPLKVWDQDITNRSSTLRNTLKLYYLSNIALTDR